MTTSPMLLYLVAHPDEINEAEKRVLAELKKRGLAHTVQLQQRPSQYIMKGNAYLLNDEGIKMTAGLEEISPQTISWGILYKKEE